MFVDVSEVLGGSGGPPGASPGPALNFKSVDFKVKGSVSGSSYLQFAGHYQAFNLSDGCFFLGAFAGGNAGSGGDCRGHLEGGVWGHRCHQTV